MNAQSAREDDPPPFPQTALKEERRPNRHHEKSPEDVWVRQGSIGTEELPLRRKVNFRNTRNIQPEHGLANGVSANGGTREDLDKTKGRLEDSNGHEDPEEQSLPSHSPGKISSHEEENNPLEDPARVIEPKHGELSGRGPDDHPQHKDPKEEERISCGPWDP